MATLKLSDVRSAYVEASKKVSDIVRQLGLAGIALVWVFKGGTGTVVNLDPKLITAALWITVALALDFSQYLITTYVWFFFFRHKEKQNPDLEQELLPPAEMNWPNLTFFLLKNVALLLAYCRFLIPYIWWKLHS